MVPWEHHEAFIFFVEAVCVCVRAFNLRNSVLQFRFNYSHFSRTIPSKLKAV